MENSIWSYCKNCLQETKHQILFQKESNDGKEDNPFLLSNKFQIVECRGCENISMRHELVEIYITFDKNDDDETETDTTVKIFPPQIYYHKPIEQLNLLPKIIRTVYEQTILALKGESNLLSAVGFRAVIEAICIVENIKGNNLEQKINNLAKNRLITEKESERLHSIRFLGNDSVHEMEIPNENKLGMVRDIIEHLLNNLYILDSNSQSLLDTIVKDYEKFKSLVTSCLSHITDGKTMTLKGILGKHIRRIPTDLDKFESLFCQQIKDGKYDYLSIYEEKGDKITGETIVYSVHSEKYNSELPF